MPLDRLPPLSDDLRDWLDGGVSTGHGRTRGSGSPVGNDAPDVELGTRLEELARLSSTDPGDGAAGVAVDFDQFPAPLPAAIDPDEPHVQEILNYLMDTVGGDVGRTVKVDFTYATASPLTVTSIAADELVVESDVVMNTAFDGPTSALLLGFTASPGAIFSAGELRPKKVGQFHSEEIVGAGAASSVILTITPGGSSTGAGFVLLTIKKV